MAKSSYESISRFRLLL